PVQWVPIPRDRDQAFVRFDGLMLVIARGTAPQLVKFGHGYPGMLGLTWNGRDLDRRLLVSLERATFDSVASDLQGRLTDAVIEGAVANLPPSYLPLDSARLASALKARRDGLLDAAGRYHRHLAGEVDIHATDAAELVVAERQEGGVTELTIASRTAEGAFGEPYFRRRFDRRETGEMRIFLHGGDDRVTVRGEGGGGIRLRVIGGGGADQVVDSSRTGPVKLYASGDGDSVLPGRGVAISRKPYAPAKPAQRDWGNRWLSQIWFSSGPDIGAFFGTGLLYTRYGFRKDPFAKRYRLRAGYATGASTVRGEFFGEWRRENSGITATLLARGSGIEVLRFYDYGNETSSAGPSEFFRVNQTDFLLAPGLSIPLAPRLRFSLGPRVRYSSTDF
ncbi:MAG: hypothetical protein ACREMG_09380, partial [Gemmatimonadales bacterium]